MGRTWPQAAGAADAATSYAYDQAAGLTNAAGLTWDQVMNEAYKVSAK